MCLSFHYLSRSPASRRFARSALKSSTISSTVVAFPTAAAGVTVPAGPVAPAAPAGPVAPVGPIAPAGPVEPFIYAQH